jgi:hypothetical protein
MIVLFTDYGASDPYLGQVEAVLYDRAPHQKVVRLLADAPDRNPRASAYLLAAFADSFPDNAILFAVVDPDVGDDHCTPVILRIDQRWYVGPDNGQFDLLARRAQTLESWEIAWRPQRLSRTFHGRDLYAPVCAMLANTEFPAMRKFAWTDRRGWPDDLHEVVYIDHYGNAMTGTRSAALPPGATLRVAGRELVEASTFAAVARGASFWHENANGLVEFAVNMGSVAAELQLAIGTPFEIVAPR